MDQDNRNQQQPQSPRQQQPIHQIQPAIDKREHPSHETDLRTDSESIIHTKDNIHTEQGRVFATTNEIRTEHQQTTSDYYYGPRLGSSITPQNPSKQEAQNLQNLLEVVKNSASTVQKRVTAIKELALFGEQVPNWVLTRALTNTEKAVRIAALETYAELAYRFPSALVAAAFADEDRSVRATTAWALGFFSRDSQAPLLRAIADDLEEYSIVRAAALQSLGRLKDKRSVKHIIAILSTPPAPSPASEDDDTRWHEREAAALALGDIGDKSAIPTLIKASKADPNVYVRAAAANALTRM